ncbi:putative 4-hydroxyphenylpyruvate dioxygenase [Polychaeton citri CBS 116435]|uniref:4-hydroxyphenylpyruvate dioxygenase n=1 Tax=Polychaeton citri CBS 116435 TaxID=1314669 RepID=A0A9P4Q4A0_9PEZI|nr:putative 4-hydroxyphenylpyruvate dioxygenase [Polychaeton citri CBS 116435]
MSITMDSLGKIPLCYATCSIGCKDEHTLPRKLDAIAAAGFQSIELSMSDLQPFAGQLLKKEVGSHDFDDLCTAAREVRSICNAKGLGVTMLQPFANFEGWPEGSEERKDAWLRAEGWNRIMEAAGTDILQIGSSDSPQEKIGTDRSRMVKDLQELADIMAKKNLRIAYENWCWSTHAPNWEDVWDICQLVDRPNFGLCLDTFQSAGGEWADPTTESGMVEDGRSSEQVEKEWKASCEKLAKTIPAEKIYLLQISDAYKTERAFDSRDIGGMRPRCRWSHDFRPLPFEGYLPVVDFAKSVLGTGFRGWFSYEVFDSGPDGKGKDYELDSFAKGAMQCQTRLMQECAK